MDNINRSFDKFIKFLLVALLCIMLIIISLFAYPPSFASNDFRPLVTRVDSMSAYPQYGTNFYNDVTFASVNVSGTTYYLNMFAVSNIPVYYAFYLDGTIKRVVFAVENLPSTDIQLYYGTSYRGGSGSTLSSSHFSAYSGIYYKADTSTGFSFDNLLVGSCYNSKYSAVEAIADYIANPPGPEPSNGTVIVRPGNVAYIGYDEGYCNISIRLPSAMKSFTSNARIGWTSSRPAENSSLLYDSSFGSTIPLMNSQPRDFVGRSTYFQYHETLSTVGYCVLYNPAYNDEGETNLPIEAFFSNYLSVVQFPLTADLSTGSIVSTGSSNVFYGSQGADMMSAPGVPEYIYSNEGVTSSALDVPISPYNYYSPEQTEDGVIAGFVQRIINLLSAPVQHIQNLFNEASTFMTWLSGLWSWLPVEVVGILTSALIVLIVVGVIKVFWK